jgi:hypothetical protein
MLFINRLSLDAQVIFYEIAGFGISVIILIPFYLDMKL